MPGTSIELIPVKYCMNTFIHALDPSRIWPIDYADPLLPAEAREAKPTVYANTPEHNVFCCIVGGNPQNGIFGQGPSPHEAIRDWAQNYRAAQNELKNTQ
jgi:hypothetical protein